MEERNHGAEIDALRDELRQIRELLTARVADGNPGGQPETLPPVGHIYPMRHMNYRDDRLSSLMEEMCVKAGTEGAPGMVTYMGVYSSGGRQSNWMQKDIGADELLSLIETKKAEEILGSVGSGDRLNLLLTLLRQPKTVAELVENHGYTSTGQVYHHLKPLMANKIVCEVNDSRGRYAVRPDKVQGILMLLAGVKDLLGE